MLCGTVSSLRRIDVEGAVRAATRGARRMDDGRLIHLDTSAAGMKGSVERRRYAYREGVNRMKKNEKE